MKDYNIEYAHIYTNQQINKEHELSLEILNDLKKEIGEQNIALSIMVDDYSFPDPLFDYNFLIQRFEQSNNIPHVMIRESQLIPWCDVMLGLIEDQDRKLKLQEYIITKKKYPCSLFIATWYCIRLGLIDCVLVDKDMTGKKLINILPESFKPFEDQGFEIIATTKFRNYLENIENRYFDGRLLV